MDETQAASASRSRRIIPIFLLLLVLVGGGIAIFAATRPSASAPAGPEGVPIASVPDLASASTSATGVAIDGITCRKATDENVKYHIHIHVQVFVNGSQRRLPAGIGVTSPPLVEHYKSGTFLDVGPYNCLYWIHTHAADGIVHVEAPAKGSFTLGQLFDIWSQPLSATQAGPAHGPVVIFVNGTKMGGDPRAVVLAPHSNIQINVGSATPYRPFSFTVTGGCGQGTTSCTTPTASK